MILTTPRTLRRLEGEEGRMQWDVEIALQVMNESIEWTSEVCTPGHTDVGPLSIGGLCPGDMKCSTTYIVSIQH
jgi:hypothetical protein